MESKTYTQSMKARKVNIGTEEIPKFAQIGDYWDEETIEKIAYLLHEYQDIFQTTFSNMKGIAGEIGEIRIPLKPGTKPVKQRPYRMKPRYKEKVKEEIDCMLKEGVIESVQESEWISPMVVKEKKIGGIIICFHLRKLNEACLHDPFPMPFIFEVLESVGGQEAYSFIDGFLGYHHIRIAQEYRHNTTFVTEWGSFQYTMLLFGLKNAHAVFSKVVVTTFKEFIHNFIEVYLDDWTIFILLQDHNELLRFKLDKCGKHQISLNLKKCIFCAPFKILLGHMVCKQGLIVDTAKIAVIMDLQPPTSVKTLHATIGHTWYYRKFIKGYT
jgi:hypothetical protein